jgi:formiminoglutamase
MQKDPILNNLSDRDLERCQAKFKEATHYSINFINFSSDEGVIRNGGRRGSSLGPVGLLNVFKKMASSSHFSFKSDEVTSIADEQKDFDEAQKKSSKKIIRALDSLSSKKTIFLGGGHDHVYPTLIALESLHPDKKIIILNIDPHTDTRIDDFKSSGTPFRQFDEYTKKGHQLIQIGSEKFANVESSKKSLKNLSQKIYSFEEIKMNTMNFKENIPYFSKIFGSTKNDEALYFISLDVDAIESSVMEAVSAVNHQGLPLHFIEDLFTYLNHQLECRYFGIYEYNPVYDNLSQKGARAISSLIYRLLD